MVRVTAPCCRRMLAGTAAARSSTWPRWRPAIKGVPNRFAYGASKAAVIGLTKSVAADFVGRGVRCNAICPGTVETPSLRGRIAARPRADPAGAGRARLRRPPADGAARHGGEIAALAVYPPSDDARLHHRPGHPHRRRRHDLGVAAPSGSRAAPYLLTRSDDPFHEAAPLRRPGPEKPGLLDAAGRVRDLSGHRGRHRRRRPRARTLARLAGARPRSPAARGGSRASHRRLRGADRQVHLHRPELRRPRRRDRRRRSRPSPWSSPSGPAPSWGRTTTSKSRAARSRPTGRSSSASSSASPAATSTRPRRWTTSPATASSTTCRSANTRPSAAAPGTRARAATPSGRPAPGWSPPTRCPIPRRCGCGSRSTAGAARTAPRAPWSSACATRVLPVSRFMSLQPGDVISTGTPPGVGLGQKPPVFLRAGQTMRLGIEGLGEQRQRVVSADPGELRDHASPTCASSTSASRPRRALDGSDAMNPDPDYSAAYVILETDAPGRSPGHGLTFTIGRGNEIVLRRHRGAAPPAWSGCDIAGITATSGRVLAPRDLGQPAALDRPGQGRHPPRDRGGGQRGLGPVGQEARQAGLAAGRRHDPGGARPLHRLPLHHGLHHAGRGAGAAARQAGRQGRAVATLAARRLPLLHHLGGLARLRRRQAAAPRPGGGRRRVHAHQDEGRPRPRRRHPPPDASRARPSGPTSS